MKRDDIIRMARESGMLIPSFRIGGGLALWTCTAPDFERFAGLVAKFEREALRAKIEAAEKSDAESLTMYRKARDERDALRAALQHEADCVEASKAEIKALRAKIERMEQQVPICRAEDLCHAEILLPSLGLMPEDKLYALPGAQPVTSASEDGLPERCSARPAEQQGLFRKFIVRRTDGSDAPGGKHYGCRYFVLDVDHDKHAVAALTAYAKACETTHPELAKDLREKWGAQPAPSVPDGVAEALQRLIENGAVFGPASSEDALLVARYRQHLLSSAPSISPAALFPVIQWLRNGCDPMKAAKELEILIAAAPEAKP